MPGWTATVSAEYCRSSTVREFDAVTTSHQFYALFTGCLYVRLQVIFKTDIVQLARAQTSLVSGASRSSDPVFGTVCYLPCATVACHWTRFGDWKRTYSDDELAPTGPAPAGRCCNMTTNWRIRNHHVAVVFLLILLLYKTSCYNDPVFVHRMV